MQPFGSPPPERVRAGLAERALVELAERQWGVVTLEQLRALGLGDGAVKHRLKVGRLHRLHHGVYALGHSALERRGRWLAAVLACGPGAGLSHVTGAAHRGLLHTSQALIDVTGPRSRTGGTGIRLHRSRSLDARDITSHDGIPVTTVARTLLDLAGTVSAGRLERAFAQSLHLRIYDHRAVTELLARANGHRGRRALTELTALEPKLTRSDWELRMLKLIRDAGLPEPLVNHALVAQDYGHCEVDFYWPAHELIVETDSWSAHGTRAIFETDRARDAALQAVGYRVVRFTWRTDDSTILRRLRALIARSRPRSG